LSFRFGLRNRFCSRFDGAFLDDGEQLTAEHRVALSRLDFFQGAIDGSRHFEYYFIGFEVYQLIVAMHGISRLFVPGSDDRVLDGLRQYRYFYFDGHNSFPLLNSLLAWT